MEAKLYEYIIKAQKNGSAVSLQVQPGGRHDITVTELAVIYGWMRHFVARDLITINMSNNNGTETTRSFQGEAGQFSVLKLRKQQDRQGMLARP